MDALDPHAFFARHDITIEFVHRTDEEMRDIYVTRGRMSNTAYKAMVKRGMGPVFANLHNAETGKPFWPNFGGGRTEEEAAVSAVQRWRSQEGG